MRRRSQSPTSEAARPRSLHRHGTCTCDSERSSTEACTIARSPSPACRSRSRPATRRAGTRIRIGRRAWWATSAAVAIGAPDAPRHRRCGRARLALHARRRATGLAAAGRAHEGRRRHVPPPRRTRSLAPRRSCQPLHARARTVSALHRASRRRDRTRRGAARGTRRSQAAARAPPRSSVRGRPQRRWWQRLEHPRPVSLPPRRRCRRAERRRRRQRRQRRWQRRPQRRRRRHRRRQRRRDCRRLGRAKSLATAAEGCLPPADPLATTTHSARGRAWPLTAAPATPSCEPSAAQRCSRSTAERSVAGRRRRIWRAARAARWAHGTSEQAQTARKGSACSPAGGGPRCPAAARP